MRAPPLKKVCEKKCQLDAGISRQLVVGDIPLAQVKEPSELRLLAVLPLENTNSIPLKLTNALAYAAVLLLYLFEPIHRVQRHQRLLDLTASNALPKRHHGRLLVNEHAVAEAARLPHASRRVTFEAELDFHHGFARDVTVEPLTK